MAIKPDTTPAAPGASRLAGLRVVIVEDEAMLLLALEDMVASMGCQVVGTASRLASALDLVAEAAFDLAILDVNLNGARVDEAADIVIARGVPVVFATGYSGTGVTPCQREWPIVHKPYTQDDLALGMAEALARTRRD